eukprot:TRINITY_DN13808_c0_g1_i2.p1 TRINITY_DN13808_c0_g1~~TRINITY_DN13808_c0_g1_i2.p1  ORF type:complete len:1336 (-),score=303.89 TRINITY_DN13808_c0_g1_i2:192-4199(-)
MLERSTVERLREKLAGCEADEDISEEELVEYGALVDVLAFWSEQETAEVVRLLRNCSIKDVCAQFLAREAGYREARMTAADERPLGSAGGSGPMETDAGLHEGFQRGQGKATVFAGGWHKKSRRSWLVCWLKPRWPWMLLSMVLSLALGLPRVPAPACTPCIARFPPAHAAVDASSGLLVSTLTGGIVEDDVRPLESVEPVSPARGAEALSSSPPPPSSFILYEFLSTRPKVPEASTRRLAGSSGSSSGSGNSTDSSLAGHEEHQGHPHDALFFLFSCLVIGTLVLHSTMLPMLAHLQQTVALFVLGVVYALILERVKTDVNLGIITIAYDMWMQIDPHLLLFALLPVLLTGDAMTIDTAVARRVAKRCVILAGPGVLIGSFATAVFLWVYIPYDWPFLLCLVTGSILAATDPVAVVSLLKELGASPALTVSIQGESLLNDGTAIVLYMMAFDMLKGVSYDAGDVIVFLVKTALCALGLGALLGWIFLLWIRAAADRLNHHSGIIQSALTLCCAYWSFILAEGVLKMSGVLCTVAAALILADHMWPSVTEKDTLLHIWHMFEYLGNTLIFFLAGSLTGKTMYTIPAIDYFHLIVIYLMSQLIRFSLIFGFRPLLTLLTEDGEAVTKADAVVMAWGGLRGAVGLALAIQVSMDTGDWNKNREGDRVLFYVGGVAAMTLCINAPTCPPLVKWLGITTPPTSRQRLLFKLHDRLQQMSAASQNEIAVKDAVKIILQDARVHIENLVPDSDQPDPAMESLSQVRKSSVGSTSMSAIMDFFNLRVGGFMASADELLKKLEEAKEEYRFATENDTIMDLVDLPEFPFAEPDIEDNLAGLVSKRRPDIMTLKCINETFLALVRSQYWRQIEDGEFFSGVNDDADLLLNSINSAFVRSNTCLADYKYLRRQLKLVHEYTRLADNQEDRRSTWVDMAGGKVRASVLVRKANEDQRNGDDNWEQFFSNNIPFNSTMATVILLNAAFIVVGELIRTAENDKHLAWLVIEVIFNALFLFEFIFKVGVLKLGYFRDGWNVFDFILVVLGLVGLVFEGMAHGSSSSTQASVSSEARLLRFNRVFRVLRICRVFRLVRFVSILLMRLATKDFNAELAEHLHSVTVLRAFVRAHVAAQQQLLTYLGFDGEVSTPEEARCILESQTSCYQAAALAAKEANKLEKSILKGINLLRKNIGATQELRHFVHKAWKCGMISEKEAETILKPLQDHVRIFFAELSRSQSGVNLGVAAQNEDYFQTRSLHATAHGGGSTKGIADDMHEEEVQPFEDEDEVLGKKPETLKVSPKSGRSFSSDEKFISSSSLIEPPSPPGCCVADVEQEKEPTFMQVIPT